MTVPHGPRAALVHDWMTGMRGGEKVLECLAEMLPRAPIHTLFHFPGTMSHALERRDIRTSSLQAAPGLRRHYRRYLPLFPTAIEEFDLSGYELVVSSSHCVAKGALAGPGGYHVCYCHTPMRYAWDQEKAYFPRRTGAVARVRARVLARLRAWDVAASVRVDRFVANSRFVAERIRRYYGRDADVVPPPVDTEFFTPGDGAAAGGAGYCLYVSALAPYKRIDLAIAACARLGLELRIVGDGPERGRLERLAQGGVRLLGRVPADELRALYRGALCFVQPGIEDFGISAVEALACGCPVVALDRGGVRDIVESGEHGLLYAGEGDAEALAAAIEALRRRRPEPDRLRRRAERFSRDLFGRRMAPLLAPPGRAA